MVVDIIVNVVTYVAASIIPLTYSYKRISGKGVERRRRNASDR